MFTEIIAAGAMGVSVFFAIKAHSLLKDEQAKDQPRPAFLRSIYVFMGFALLMTPLALGIEYARHQMNLDNTGADQAGFAKQLVELENKTFYALNKNGNPEAIEVTYAGVTYQLASPLPETVFENTELKLKPNGNQRYLAVKDNNGDEITYGFLSGAYLKANLEELLTINTIAESPEQPQDEVLESEKLMSTGLMYAPWSPIRDRVHQELTAKRANAKITNKYLVEFVNPNEAENPLQELALDLLIQPEQLRVFDSIKYEKLLSTLAAEGVRGLPHRHYELAQVHYSRWAQYQDDDDLKAYRQLICQYVKSYEALRWINENPEKYKLEKKWYDQAKTDLAQYRCDGACNC